MTGVLEKHELRKSLEKNVPERLMDIAFGGETHTTAFNQMWDAIVMHFGEMELVARREYERGYYDGVKGRKPRPYQD